MPIGQSISPRWQYACDCRKCTNVQRVDDDSKKRHGGYCIPSITLHDAGLPGPLHADDDRIIRCDCFTRKGALADA